jgi:hypothetical protein
VIRLHVDAAGPTDDLAAIDGTLEGNTRNTKRLKVPRTHDPVSLKIPQSRPIWPVAGMVDAELVLQILCRNDFPQRLRNILMATSQNHIPRALSLTDSHERNRRSRA